MANRLPPFHLKYISNFTYETGGEIGGDGGLDYDQHIYIALLSVKSFIPGVILCGFYDPYQSLSEEEAKITQNNLFSRGFLPSKKQIIFITSEFLNEDFSDDIIQSVLFHEYQHLSGIETIKRKFPSLTENDIEKIIFITEGASMLVEEIFSPDFTIKEIIQSQFLHNKIDNLADFNNKDSLAGYSNVYTYFSYYNRLFGYSFLKEITSLSHVRSIDSFMSDIFSLFKTTKPSAPQDFKDSIRKFAVACLEDNEFERIYSDIFGKQIKGFNLSSLLRYGLGFFPMGYGIDYKNKTSLFSDIYEEYITLEPNSYYFLKLGKAKKNNKIYLYFRGNDGNKAEIFFTKKIE